METLKQSLENLEIFSHDDLALLKAYNIYTLEQLLGATKGLLIIERIDGLSDIEIIRNKLLLIVPPGVLSDYQQKQENYPFGLIPEKHKKE